MPVRRAYCRARTSLAVTFVDLPGLPKVDLLERFQAKWTPVRVKKTRRSAGSRRARTAGSQAHPFGSVRQPRYLLPADNAYTMFKAMSNA